MTDNGEMRRLLFLSHRIPYPPNKGDKIRSFHMLEYLFRRYEVCLGTFVDDENDWQYVPALQARCVDSHFANLDRRRARAGSLRALFTGEALSVRYYQDKGLRQWVEGMLSDRSIQRIVVFSSVMAQYLSSSSSVNVHRIVDFVDIDSDKWAQYGASMPWPKSWIYRREAGSLARYERQVARAADASLFVSEVEAELFRHRAPEVAGRIHAMNNGVDTEYFSPERPYPNPYVPGRRGVVFTGAMDYWPNVNAVTWFAREIFPLVRRAAPDAWFYIVGARPAPTVAALAQEPNVKVTGTVGDVRPYLAHARMAVAPLRVSRGVQNKVLEAMAMARPLVATTKALEGIKASAHLDGVDDAAAFAARVIKLLADGNEASMAATALREHVMRHYNWERNLQGLAPLLEDGMVSRHVA